MCVCGNQSKLKERKTGWNIEKDSQKVKERRTRSTRDRETDKLKCKYSQKTERQKDTFHIFEYHIMHAVLLFLICSYLPCEFIKRLSVAKNCLLSHNISFGVGYLNTQV